MAFNTSEPRMLQPSARPHLILLFCFMVGCSNQEELPPSGVLITLDTTTPFSLDVYGKHRGLTPAIQKLADEGLTFERAYTTAPITLPAHTSMMTGLYPLRHGVRTNGLMELNPQAETLAERAQEAGFQTAAFFSAQVLANTYRLDQGFDLYKGPGKKTARPGAAINELRSKDVTDAALAWIGNRDPQRPFFLWVHYFDPHAPYDAPPEFLARTKGNLYLAEVATMDVDIGRLLSALDEWVGKDEFMLAVVADHGEALGRHGENTHAGFCYESTMRVPFILRFPDGRRAGERVQEVVSVVDIFPTFLDELGLGTPGDVDGVSLSQGPFSPERGVYLESYNGFYNYGWSPLAGWVDAKGKYLHSSKPEFYSLEVDPKESKNLFGQEGTNVASYVAALQALTELPRLAAGAEVELNEEQLVELRKLGYTASGSAGEDGPPDPLDESTRMAPVDGVAGYSAYSEAEALVMQGKLEPAIESLRAILAENPDHIGALETLSGALLEQADFAGAVELLDLVLARYPTRYRTHVYLAIAHENLGNLETALKHLRSAQLIRPNVREIEAEIERVKKRL